MHTPAKVFQIPAQHISRYINYVKCFAFMYFDLSLLFEKI